MNLQLTSILQMMTDPAQPGGSCGQDIQTPAALVCLLFVL